MNIFKIIKKETKHKRKWLEMKTELNRLRQENKEINDLMQLRVDENTGLNLQIRTLEEELNTYKNPCKDGVCQIDFVDVEIVEDPRAEFLGINQYYNN